MKPEDIEKLIETVSREAFNAARLAYRTDGAMQGVPGQLLKLPDPNCWLFADYEEFAASWADESEELK